MRRFLLFLPLVALSTGCNTDNDDSGNGWNNLGRSCGNGHHADFSFNMDGGQNLSFVSGEDEVTLAIYSEGSSVTSTQLTYGWDEGIYRYSVGIAVNQRLETGSISINELSEGSVILTIDSSGTGIQQYQSSGVTLTIDEVEYESRPFGGERVIHVEGSYNGTFRKVISFQLEEIEVSGEFCLHGYAD